LSTLYFRHRRAAAQLAFRTLASTFSLTACFSWGLGGGLARQPFQRLSADGKPAKADISQ
jgi:hypothetical protein